MTAASPAPAAPAGCSSTAHRSRRAASSALSAASSPRTRAPMPASKKERPVSEDYQVPFKFTGRIDRVTVEVKNPSPAEQDADDKADANAKLNKDLYD